MIRETAVAVLGVLMLAGTVSGQWERSEPAERAARRAAMISRIDFLLAERWQAAGVQPASPSSDAEFLRRLSLDLTGVIPHVSEVRAFVQDDHQQKRARLIDSMLHSPSYATHMANTWRNVLLPGGINAEDLTNVAGVQNWLRDQFVRNFRYDRMVNEFLVATGGGQTGPALYYTSLELQPEKLASSTARIFLGLQIQCAQCHDHPTDRWRQEDFWGYAAFFARLQQSDSRGARTVQIRDGEAGEVTLPDSETVVKPRYPGGQGAAETDLGTRRQQLAIWIASRENPYLSRAAVNRVWAQLFGIGLVEPVDDLGPHNPASHPELLDELAAHFVDSGYDIQELLRTLAGTRAYQLSSRADSGSEVPPELFARMAVKPLTAEQLFDSLSRALLRPSTGTSPDGQTSSRLFDRQRIAFIGKMDAQSSSGLDYLAGVPQALTLMNGREISEATDIERGGILMALESPLFTAEEQLEILFAATLSRAPTSPERAKFGQYISSGGPTADQRQALADVLWALLNSAEFAMNH